MRPLKLISAVASSSQSINSIRGLNFPALFGKAVRKHQLFRSSITMATNRRDIKQRDTAFGKILFEPNHERHVDTLLHQKLAKEHLSFRPGPGGRKLTYIESCRAIEFANQAFGFNGWSCEILECKEEYRVNRGDKWHVSFSSVVRIQLKDGTYHEDVGFGQSDGQRDLGAALETAKKACISDARKRALRCFGEYLGNSCYDKDVSTVVE